MEVILLERVAKLGQMGDTIRVKDGFARNYLLPQGKALRATAANKAKFQTMKGELVTIEERNINEIADPKKFPNVKFRNPVFDATPADYIDAIITEKGVIAPHAAYDLIKDEFKEVDEWNL